MIATKVVGAVEELWQNSARVKVLSFRSNGQLIRDSKAIIEEFPPYGYVYAKDLFQENDLHSLIEFQVFQSNSSSYGKDVFIVDQSKKVKYTGIRIVPTDIPNSIVHNTIYINTLTALAIDDNRTIYIQQNQYIYGPFKSANSQFIPQTPSKAYKYNYSPSDVYQSGETLYLLSKPEIAIDEMDCMTEVQLAEWFKKKIPSLFVDIDINEVKQAFSSVSADSLDQSRFQRVLTDLNAISFTRNEIRTLSENSEKLSSLYIKALNDAKKSLEELYLDDILRQKENIEEAIKTYNRQLSSIKEKYSKDKEDLDKLRREVTHLTENKERLIYDIRANIEIASPIPTSTRLLLTYNEQSYTKEGQPYSDLQQFISSLHATLKSFGFDQAYLPEKVIYQFRHKKSFLCNNIHLVLVLAKATGNCKIIIQQVEPDWIKFESLYENGLKQVWKSAHQHPQIIHLFILEDINISSIECYARPVLDILSGARALLPVEGTKWPANMWMIGIPFERPDNYEFGLPLLKNSFQNWGAFPMVTRTDLNTESNTLEPLGRILLPEILYAHDKLEISSLDEYFTEQ